jgi:5-methylcytosine-specific restriction enzyme subunit McrC
MIAGPGAADRRFVTALEHDPIPITAQATAWSLTVAEAERLARIGEQRPGFCDMRQRHVKLAQFCGVVGLGQRVLEVLPKVDDRVSSPEDCRGVLLRLLRLSGRLPDALHQAAGQHVRRMPLLEAFIAAFFGEVAVLARGGLLRQYLQEEDDLALVRGRIDLRRQLGTHANRRDLVACAFDELTADNVWNRTLKKATRLTRPWIRSLGLQRQWVDLMGLLDDVDDSRLMIDDVERLTFNRQAERYRPAVEWARWILALLSPALRAGQNEAPALLFDMNSLFESAIAATAFRLGGDVGIVVDAQDRTKSLVNIVSPERVETSFALRPDLVFRRRGTVVAIADTKWKLVDVDRRGRLMPGEADMYQMHAYAAAFRCHDLALVYPWRSDLDGAAAVEFRLPPIDDLSPRVKVLCVDLERDDVPLRIGRWPFEAS